MTCLAGLRVLLLDLQPKEIQTLCEQLSSLGAIAQTTPDPALPPQFVVADRCGSPTFYEILSVNSDPAPLFVSKAWVSDCFREKERKNPAGYQLRPFTGLLICVTGLPQEERDKCEYTVKALGGTYSKDLFRHCTHLLCKQPTGDKYKHAIQWGGITVVRPEWLDECEALQLCAPVGKYLFNNPTAGVRGCVSGPTVKVETSYGGLTGPVTATNHQVHPQAAAHARAAAAACCTGAGLQPQPDGPAPSTSLAAHHSTQRTTPFAAVAAAEPAAVLVASTSAAVELDEDSLYLDWVKMHLVGCTQWELDEVARLICQCGASRWPDLNPHITHIVVGSDAAAAALQVVREHLVNHRGAGSACVAVRPSWLRACVDARRAVPAEGELRALPQDPAPACAAAQQPPQLTRALSRGLAGAAGRQPSQALQSLGSLHPADMPDQDTRLGEALAGAGALSQLAGAGSSSMGPPGPFSMLWFTTSMVCGAELARAQELIREGGGRFFTAASAHLVKDFQFAYAVCPPGMSDKQVAEKERGCEEVKQVPRGQWVTLFWLETSVRLGATCPLVRDAPAFRPLRHNLPLEAFSKIRISASVYAEETKEAMAHLIQILGGTYTQNICGKSDPASGTLKNTHLLLPDTSSDKVMFCLKRGIKLVTHHWLVQSADKGRPLDEINFLPREVEGRQLADLMAAASQAAGASQLAATQLPSRAPAASRTTHPSKSCGGGRQCMGPAPPAQNFSAPAPLKPPQPLPPLLGPPAAPAPAPPDSAAGSAMPPPPLPATQQIACLTVTAVTAASQASAATAAPPRHFSGMFKSVLGDSPPRELPATILSATPPQPAPAPPPLQPCSPTHCRHVAAAQGAPQDVAAQLCGGGGAAGSSRRSSQAALSSPPRRGPVKAVPVASSRMLTRLGSAHKDRDRGQDAARPSPAAAPRVGSAADGSAPDAQFDMLNQFLDAVAAAPAEQQATQLGSQMDLASFMAGAGPPSGDLSLKSADDGAGGRGGRGNAVKRSAAAAAVGGDVQETQRTSGRVTRAHSLWHRDADVEGAHDASQAVQWDNGGGVTTRLKGQRQRDKSNGRGAGTPGNKAKKEELIQKLKRGKKATDS